MPRPGPALLLPGILDAGWRQIAEYSSTSSSEYPMGLKEQITEDMKAAMRAKDMGKLGTIRL